MSAFEEVSNANRADFAHDAIDPFCIKHYSGRDFDKLVAEAQGSDIIGSDAKDAISDLICDLMHLARRHGIDPNRCISSATSNFEAEEAETGKDQSDHDDQWQRWELFR